MRTSSSIESGAGPLRRLDYWPGPLALGAGILAGVLGVLALPLLGIGGWAAWLAPAVVLALALGLVRAARPIARLIPGDGTAGVEIPVEPEPALSPYFDPPDPSALPPELHEDLLLRPIPGGAFDMGSAEDDPAAEDSEKPRHPVRVPPFELMAFQVTRRLYRDIAGKDPGYPEGKADRRPVNNVSWQDAALFCNLLSWKLEFAPCYDEETWACDPSRNGFRLPSEAEWEYAARAGGTGNWCFGDEEGLLEEYAVYGKDYESGPDPVGGRKPNRWGLHDMHGNVWEWVEDHWHDGYKGAPDDGAAWLHGDKSGESERVLRGGSFSDPPGNLRSAFRNWYWAGWGRYIGFRCARSARQP